ncbi:MAG: MgtC/SapB family protein [Armatimonadota bacterium]
MSSEPLWILLKLAFATVCGGIVGWQREARDRPAGFRTHVLVCLGATVYTLASLAFTSANADPGRVAAQVATGMGFLGAGTIIRHGNVVRGLTTAASLWAVAAIGLCVAIGGHAWWVAGIATLLVLATLTVLRSVERLFVPRIHSAILALRLTDPAAKMDAIRQQLAAHSLRLQSVEVSRVGAGGVQELRLHLSLPATCDLMVVGPQLAQLEGFTSLTCE